MEKILLVMDAKTPDNTSVDFAAKIADLTNSRLTAVFIENLNFHSIPMGGIDNPAYFAAFEQQSVTLKADTEQTVRIFKETCQKKGIIADVYVDKGDPIKEVIFESRFADLMIIDPAINFYNREEEMPSDFIREILSFSECPVMLSPEEFDDIEEIVFCYDGSVSSVFAIKQFSYLLPEFSNKKALLLEVKKTSRQEFNEKDRRMMDWLHTHYSFARYHSLNGDVKDELFAYLFMQKNKLVVMGAYGRSLLSNLFKKSSADLLIRTVDLPLFITHH